MEDKELLIKGLLENYPTLKEQLELNLFDLEILKEYYLKKGKQEIAVKFDNAKKTLLKF